MMVDKKYPDPYLADHEIVEDGWDYVHEVLNWSVNERQSPRWQGRLSKAVYCQPPFTNMECKPELPAAIKGTRSEPAYRF